MPPVRREPVEVIARSSGPMVVREPETVDSVRLAGEVTARWLGSVMHLVPGTWIGRVSGLLSRLGYDPVTLERRR